MAYRVETVLADVVNKRYSKTGPGRKHVEDIAALRDQMELDKPLGSYRSPIGMKRGGSLLLKGSIPIEIWTADERLRPGLTCAERANDLLSRFKQFAYAGGA